MSLGARAHLTAELLHELAVEVGACVRPVLKLLTDTATGEQVHVPLACGSTRESKCPSCAAKARRLRIQQCREGWHLDAEPPPTEASDADEADSVADETAADEGGAGRRVRSTRRRQDSPDLPRVHMAEHTVGRTFTSPQGKTYRPSMFVTLTLPSYGRVDREGTPLNPAAYDYRRAALDAIHFPKLVDRWWQNLRRCAGYRVQYFAVVEPQRRLAPHLHAGVRGAIPRDLLRQIAAATYHQVWWPSHDRVVFEVDTLPTWSEAAHGYVDRDGTILPTWEQALDALDDEMRAQPAHVVRLGSQLDVQGILAETHDADRRVSYLCKYLTKSVSETYGEDASAAQARHMDRLHDEVRWLPCSPECTNWLRFGVQPRAAVAGLLPGSCSKRAHDRENLGLGGRRVLVSRNWTGKTLTDHRADRAQVVRQVLAAAGVEAPDVDRWSATATRPDGQPRFRWEALDPTAQDGVTRKQALLASIRERVRWRREYQRAQESLVSPATHERPPGLSTSDEGLAGPTTCPEFHPTTERIHPCSQGSALPAVT